ncbi:peptidase inhibitor family I36 protein [Actinomadura sp. 6N118]|uniref:peptidase inhibitor family I36 protein n=1 Tax=Actinomadura sp. 6N118 TaxID=3375151 RepID=UPI00378E0D76
MKSVVRPAITALSAAAIMSVGAPAYAGTSAAPSDAAGSMAAPCNRGDFCIWVNTGFQGGRAVLSDRPHGSCYRFLAPPYRSFANYDNFEGYFYSNNNCTGSARAVTAGHEGNLGFNAYSFKHACVSCRVNN